MIRRPRPAGRSCTAWRTSNGLRTAFRYSCTRTTATPTTTAPPSRRPAKGWSCHLTFRCHHQVRCSTKGFSLWWGGGTKRSLRFEIKIFKSASWKKYSYSKNSPIWYMSTIESDSVKTERTGSRVAHVLMDMGFFFFITKNV